MVRASVSLLHMTVTSTALNVADGAMRCIKSVQKQTFGAWEHVFVDAKSSDNTAAFARTAASKDTRTSVLVNTVRKAALENVWEIWQTLPDDEVIVWLDGDDWLAHDRALQVVADAYNAPNEPWLTYGQFMFTNGEIGFASRYGDTPPRHDLKWRATHLKTFRAGLVKKINPASLKTPAGVWCPYAIDRAVMFPLLDMAGGRYTFIPNILYVYNAEASHWANETSSEEKDRVWDETYRIHRLPPYQRLEKRPW